MCGVGAPVFAEVPEASTLNWLTGIHSVFEEHHVAGNLTQQQEPLVLQNSRQFCLACASPNLSVRNVTDGGMWYMQDLPQTACL